MFEFNPVLRNLVLAGLFGVLSACASNIELLPVVQPELEQSTQVEAPANTAGVGMKQVENEQWWLLFSDPALTQVVELALQNNTDVRLAKERLNEAGAVLGIAKTEKYPALYGQVTGSRNRPTQVGSVPVFGSEKIYKSTTVGLGLSWELDLWGKIGAAQDAASAAFLQQGYNLRGARLSVASMTASLYTQARVLALQVNIADQTLTSRDSALKFAQQRYDAGLTNELQLSQTKSEYLSVKAQLPDLREQYAQATNALAVLVGGNLPALPELKTQDIGLTGLFILPENTPSELLLRRPDLAAAEQKLKASEANLLVARKAFFPSIGLSAFGGRESASLDDLFSGPARIWNFQAQLTQPIFQAGRLMDERDVALSRRNQSVIQYEASIRTAFQEVYNAIVAQREARDRLESRQAQVMALQDVVRLAQLRVDNGVSNQLELLDAQRNLLSAQLSWAGAWQQQQDASLAMLRALGGGFQASNM